MSQNLFDSDITSESHGLEVQPQTIGSSGSPNEENESSHLIDPDEEFKRNLKKFLQDFLRNFIPNLKALVSRIVQLSRRPEHLAPLILDFWSLLMSVISGGRQPGPDLLYPLSSLKKQKSGRLATLLLEYSRDLQQRNLHVATSSMEGVDPPCIAVIDLDEVPQEIIKSEYTVSADSHGLVAMILFLETLITLFVHLFTAIDHNLLDVLTNWAIYLFLIIVLCTYAGFRGEGTLTLVRRSDVSTPSCAILLDRDFAVVVMGAQNVVEAIAESGFSISHPAWRHELEALQFVQFLGHEALKALCQWAPLTILTVFWLLLRPSSLLMAYVPLIPTFIFSLLTGFNSRNHMVDSTAPRQEPTLRNALQRSIIMAIRSASCFLPTMQLIGIYELVVAKDPLLRSMFNPIKLLHHIPFAFFYILFTSSRNFHIRTTKLLDILGRPPIRRWEFDTLAAAVTFQCLVLCRGIPRPIKSIHVLALLDTLVPDQRDVWKAWKERVADRIAYETDILFAPTLPTFGDQRQRHLKELLDQAQIGYAAYKDFYDWHVPLYSTIAL